MNVAVHPFVLSTQRVAADVRRDAQVASPTKISIAPLRDAQKIAPGQSVGSESERREPFGERRKPSRVANAETRFASRRAVDGDERGRFLDVYC